MTQEMEILISVCPLGIQKYACQLPFSCLRYFLFGIGKNNSISRFLANRKLNYYFQHVPWDYKNMLVNFHFLVSAIFLQEQAKIIPFLVSWQTGNGIANFDMSPGNTKICLSSFIFLSQLFSFRNRQNNSISCFPAKRKWNY